MMPREPLKTDAEILAQVTYNSLENFGSSPELYSLGYVMMKAFAKAATPLYLLAWPDGVRAMHGSLEPPGSPEMNQAVVNIYRAAARGMLVPVPVYPHERV